MKIAWILPRLIKCKEDKNSSWHHFGDDSNCPMSYSRFVRLWIAFVHVSECIYTYIHIYTDRCTLDRLTLLLSWFSCRKPTYLVCFIWYLIDYRMLRKGTMFIIWKVHVQENISFEGDAKKMLPVHLPYSGSQITFFFLEKLLVSLLLYGCSGLAAG